MEIESFSNENSFTTEYSCDNLGIEYTSSSEPNQKLLQKIFNSIHSQIKKIKCSTNIESIKVELSNYFVGVQYKTRDSSLRRLLVKLGWGCTVKKISVFKFLHDKKKKTRKDHIYACGTEVGTLATLEDSKEFC